MERSVEILQIIVGAMLCGAAGFAGLATLLVQGGRGTDPSLGKMLLIVGVALAVSELAGYFVLRRSAIARLRAVSGEDETERDMKIATEYARLVIVGCAMPEGLALFGGITYMLTGARAAFALIAIALALIIVQFPTDAKYERFASHAS